MNNTAREELTRILRNHGLKDILYVLADILGEDIQGLLHANQALDKAGREMRHTLNMAEKQNAEQAVEMDALRAKLEPPSPPGMPELCVSPETLASARCDTLSSDLQRRCRRTANHEGEHLFDVLTFAQAVLDELGHGAVDPV